MRKNRDINEVVLVSLIGCRCGVDGRTVEPRYFLLIVKSYWVVSCGCEGYPTTHKFGTVSWEFNMINFTVVL